MKRKEGRKRERDVVGGRGRKEGKREKKGRVSMHTHIVNTTYVAYVGCIDFINANLYPVIIELNYIMSNVMAGFVFVKGRFCL